jgi:low temperature requirement protein LtrA
VIATRPPARHLRPRGEGVEQPITTVELFFDLVYVFAITQLSHMILGDLTVAEVGRAAFLLLVVWWAWIYTTWMANWFNPGSPAVRALLTGVMLASLLMAAALPGAFGTHGFLFAISYVVLLAESLFRLRVTGAANAERLAVAAALVLLAPFGSQISALALTATVAALLSALALWELRAAARHTLIGELRDLEPQQEGTP